MSSGATQARSSYRLDTDVRTLLGLQPEAVRIQGAEGVAKLVRSTLESSFGAVRGELAVSVSDTGAIRVDFVPRRVDDRAEKLHREAVAAARRKDLAGACAKWERAHELNREDPKYSFHAGVANFELRRLDRARELLEHAVRLCPFHHRAHLVLGTLYLKLRKLDLAEKHLEMAVRLAPTDALARLNLGAVYSVLRKYDKGVREFEEAIRLSPKDPRPHLGLAKVYSLLGKSERAEYYYRQVIRLDKTGSLRKQAQQNLTMGMTLEAPERLEPARKPTSQDARAAATEAAPAVAEDVGIEEVQQFARKYGDRDPDSLYAAAYHSYLRLNYPLALEYYGAYCGMRGSDAGGWYSLGESALRMGKLRLAVQAFRKAVEISRKPSHYKQLGLAHMLLSEFEDARSSFERARELGKKDSLLLTLLGECLARTGEGDEALRLLEEAVRENRNNLRALYSLARLAMERGDRASARRHLDELLLLPVDSPLRMEAERLMDELEKAGSTP